MSAVVLSHVSKRFGNVTVLADINLALESGELVALIGRSGSGKSTLLNVIGGLDRRFDGSALVSGVELRGLSDVALARLRNRDIGFVFQSFNLLEHLSCLENVALPSLFAPTSAPGFEARAQEALDRVGMADKAGALPSQLSGGQKQRVAIARALFHRPQVVLADEPTGNLDVQTGQQIIALFQQLNRDGLTLLVVTHEERVSQAAKRVVRIEDGRISEIA